MRDLGSRRSPATEPSVLAILGHMIVWGYFAGHHVVALTGATTAAVPQVAAQPTLATQHATASAPGPVLLKNVTNWELWAPAEHMIKWIESNGGKVNVVVANTEEAGRSTWAPTDFEEDDVLAAIPLELCYKAAAASSDHLHAFAASFWGDFTDPASLHQPYFRALPDRKEVWSLHNFPMPYLHLVQSHTVESSILRNQQQVQQHWAQHGEQIQAALGNDTTIEDLKYAMALLMTRLFNFEEDGLLLVPLLDMANHRNGCPHTHRKEPCRPSGDPVDDSAQCIVWRAGGHVSAGQEVCNNYKFMLNDRSLLQYGFLQSGAVAQQISSMDRHDFNVSSPWEDLPAGQQGPMRFEGTPAAIAVELYRLQRIKDSLQRKDKALAHMPPHPHDAGSYLLKTLHTWRQQREVALELEVERLTRQLQRMQANEDRVRQLQSSGGAARQEVYNTFLLALKKSGAQLRVAVESTAAQNQQYSSGTCSVNAAVTAPDTTSSTSSTSSAASCSTEEQAQYVISAGQSALTAVPSSGVVAAASLKAGEHLAVLPLDASVLRVYEGNDGLLDLGVDLMLKMHKARSSSLTAVNASDALWHAYYSALPPVGTLHGLYSFPLEYLPLIQNQDLETHIKAAHALTLAAWDKHRLTIEAVDDSLTVLEYKHALNLINGRLLTYGSGMYVVPLLGMVDHQLNNGCPHQDYLDQCPTSVTRSAAAMVHDATDTLDKSSSAADTDSEALCVYWIAGVDVSPGQELCVSYGFLLPDVALLQYGVMLPESQEPQLFAMDRHDFEPEQPFAALASGHDPPEPFAGTPQEALTEVARLTLLYSNLTSPQGRAAAAAVPPSPYDLGGRLLAQLHILRQQRIAAVEAEIDRLMNLYGFSADVADKAVQWLQQQQEWDRAAADAHELDEEDPWRRMISWLKSRGAVVDVDIQYVSPGAGRAVFTRHAMKRGEMLAAIPLDLAFSTARHGGNTTNQLAAANLFLMMYDASSRLQPYFKTLPTPDELLAPLVSMPGDYFPLLQSEVMVQSIRAYQQSNQQFWDAFQDDLQAMRPDMTVDDFKYARSLLSTRFFGGGPDYGNVMLPLIDMANHRQHCPHQHMLANCPGAPHLQCLVWIAGAYLQPGEEVCNFYQYMLNDRSLLQYGFLQDDMLDIHTIDRPDVHLNSSNVWSLWGADKLGPAPFNGTLQETETEIRRLTNLASALEAGNAAAAAMSPAAADPHGKLLTLILQWRQMRQQAIQRQIGILQARARQLASGQVETAQQRFMQWLNENEVKVHPSIEIRSMAKTDGLALYATAPIKATEQLAVLPLKLTVQINDEDLLDDVLKLYKGMVHPASPWRPYWDILPANGAVLSYYNLPLEYLPAIQHEATEHDVTSTRAAIEAYTAENADLLARENITIGDLLHVLSLVSTRNFQFDSYGSFLIPFVDLATHHNSCTSRLSLGHCNVESQNSSNTSGHGGRSFQPICAFWTAGSDISAGEDVCVHRGYLLPDRALLQYGLLLEENPARPQLSGIDQPDIPGGMTAWQYRMDAVDAPPLYSGTPPQTSRELNRLQKLLASLQQQDAAVAAISPSVGDESGLLLRLLRQWRETRKAAVQLEIERLRGFKQY